MVNYDPLDIELGGFRNLSNQQHWMVKGCLYFAQEIPEKLIHFPLILICLLLFPSSNPGILSEYSCIVISLIVSCLMTFVIYSIKSLCSIFRKSEDKFKLYILVKQPWVPLYIYQLYKRVLLPWNKPSSNL